MRKTFPISDHPCYCAKPRMFYIAGKYSGEVERNIAAARSVACEVFKTGHYALCPHMASSKMDEDTGISDTQFWYDATLDMLRRCDGIVMVPGWGDSKGAIAELQWALNNGLPGFYYPDLPPDVSKV